MSNREWRQVALLCLCVGVIGGAYEVGSGSAWGWALLTGTLLAAAMATAHVGVEQVASKAVSANHQHQARGVRTAHRHGDFGTVAATARLAPEVWPGWRWGHWAGCVLGGLAGAALTLLW